MANPPTTTSIAKVLLEKNEEIAVNYEYVKAKEKEVEERLRELNSEKDRREKLLHDIDDRERTLKSLNDELLAKQRILQTSEEAVKGKQAELDQKELKIKEIEKKIEEMEKIAGGDMATLGKHVDEYKKLVIKKDQELSGLREELGKANEKLLQLQSSATEKEAKCASGKKEMEKELKDATEHLKKKEIEVDSLQNQILSLKSTQQVTFSDLKSQITQKELQIASMQKELERLRGIEKQNTEDCIINLKIPVFPPADSEIDLKEIGKLQKDNGELKLLIAGLNQRLADQQEKNTVSNSGLTEMCKELQAKVVEQGKEMQEKNAMLDRLENNYRDLEVKYAKLQSEKKAVEQRQIQNSNSAELQTEKISLLSEQNTEMRSEIEVLLTQCKEYQGQIESKENQLKQQNAALEQIYIASQQKEAEIQKREEYISRLTRQLEEKKEQLHNSNLKLRQYSRTVITELNAKILEKDKEVKLLKEMVKGHHAEIKTKNQDLARLKLKLKKAIKGNEMRMDFIKTYAKMEDEEQAKQVRKMEQYDISELSAEEEEEEELKKPQKEPLGSGRKELTRNDDGVQSDSSTKLPAIDPIGLKNPYRENYLKKLDNYYQAISDAKFHNNSINMQGLLSHNYNAFRDSGRKKSEQSSLQESPSAVYTPQAAKKTPNKKEDVLGVNIDIGQIIASSISGKKTPASEDVGKQKKIRFGNLPTGPSALISPGIKKKGRNNSKT